MNKKIIVSLVMVMLIISALIFLILQTLVGGWNRVDITRINCGSPSLIKIKDIEGNLFLFEDILENNNFKTSQITFKEDRLSIKSLISVKRDNTLMTYISKNDKIKNNEYINVKNCFQDYEVTIRNEYTY